eukprot:10065173-Lingulodinium_polyedra.AAC.1
MSCWNRSYAPVTLPDHDAGPLSAILDDSTTAATLAALKPTISEVATAHLYSMYMTSEVPD